MDLGVYSEVGRLRSVLVCRPGLAHQRLTPRTCHEWHFDSPIWVERAQRDFDEFVEAMTQHGVEVLELHALLAQTLADPSACTWLLERLLSVDALGFEAPAELHQACAALAPGRLAERLIGGLTLADLGMPATGALGLASALHPYLLPPLPNALFLREANSWIQRGVTLNVCGRRGLRSEALLLAAVYRFHPRFRHAFARSELQVWWGEDVAPGRAWLEGGDIMPLGHGVVLIGVGNRTQAPAALQVAQALFDGGAATTVIAAYAPVGEPRRHGAVPLERVFTQCSPEVVTYCPEWVDRMTCQTLRPAARASGLQAQAHAGQHMLDVLSDALRVPTFNAIATGGDSLDGRPGHGEPWDDGAGVFALEPDLVIGFDRNTRTNQRLRRAGVEVIEVPGGELGRDGACLHGLCCPLARDAVPSHWN